MATSNLWHLLHILLPALARTAEDAHGPDELLIDGLYESKWGDGLVGSPLQKLSSSFAWPFLQGLSAGKRLILLGEESDEISCYEQVLWGYEAVSLFGRHKGHLKPFATRLAVQQLSSFFAESHPLKPTWIPRLLLIERPPPARRAVVNGEALRDLLRSRSWSRRLVSEWADFADEALRSDVRRQWQLASGADILIGAHGAGLAWSAFMRAGSILIELLPFLHVLHEQLCRVERDEQIAWDRTPMYAYGGLALLMGLHHVCILGIPWPAQDQGSLGKDLATWWSSSIYVDTAAVNRTLLQAINRLSHSKRPHSWGERPRRAAWYSRLVVGHIRKMLFYIYIYSQTCTL